MDFYIEAYPLIQLGNRIILDLMMNLLFISNNLSIHIHSFAQSSYRRKCKFWPAILIFTVIL
jgi:hypothetical protein